MRERAYYALYLSFRWFIRHIPASVQNPLLNVLAYLYYRLDGSRKRVARANLAFALGHELDEASREAIVKQCYRNVLFNMVDFIHNQSITSEGLLSKIKIRNPHYLKEALEKHGQCIFITAHFGNWELCSLTIGAQGTPMAVVGRKLGIEKLDRILQQNREQMGVSLLDKKGALRGMVQALRSGKSIGLLVDQNTKKSEGIEAIFIGKKVMHISTAAVLSSKFDLPIIPLFVSSQKDGYFEVSFHPPIYFERSGDQEADIQKNVQQQADIIEKVIRENPEEWFWFHRRWKAYYREIYT